MDDVPTSPRLTFRRMHAADVDAMARLLGDPAVMVHYPRPKTRDEAADWIAWSERNYARDGFGLWMLHDRAGEFVGECGLTWQRVDGEEYLEVGYHLLPEHQGKGLATEAAAACRDFARTRGIGRLVAIIVPDNHPSKRVAQRIGLVLDRESVTSKGAPIHVYAADL
ncbi:N-acetyltransferase [Nocardioides guangzhouensis]|uniref:N-acetyltransferase n=1 Tax=Nocardioides guangzhouensis TaxID=2497878 RepID=A0A4Q4ZEW4_9ACTN|nr:GNAT family N-acetyltransferase [Nocardioides guangzhouensis]RYP86700.1 N-acetyltransferase [Nocardioides guangzhouensis]